MIGNVIQQGPNDKNYALLNYLTEGTNPFNASHDLFVVNNTFANALSVRTFVQVAATAAMFTRLQNNRYTNVTLRTYSEREI